MLPKVQQLHITRLDSTVSAYRNSEYIPLFYIFPKEMLEEAGQIFLEVPRNPNFLFFDRKWIEFVESDLFLQFIIDATAYVVWPFMGLGVAREIYSGYEPSWIFAHKPQYWLEGLIEERVILSVNELYRHCKKEGSVQFQFFEFEDIEVYLNHIVKSVMAKYEMYKILDVAKEFRCHEDFDCRHSNQKTDFTRKWYHTRTQHPIISLDAEIAKYAEYNDGQELAFEDSSQNTEEQVISEVMVKQFMESLSEKDRKILEMRLERYTQEEIAEQLGYKNHSGVQKRITKIGLAYQEFTKVDLGFDEEN